MLNPVFCYPGALFWPKGKGGFSAPSIPFRSTRPYRRLMLLWDVPESYSRGLTRDCAGVMPISRFRLDNPLKVKSLAFPGVAPHSLTGKQNLDFFLPEGHPGHVIARIPGIPVNRACPALSRFRFRLFIGLLARFGPFFTKIFQKSHKSKATRKGKHCE